MKKFALLSASLAAVIVSLLPATPAQADLQIGFVASTGGGNTCSRALPCSSIGTAIDATQEGGMINCLDSGPFFGFVVSKSITIDCEEATIFAFSGNDGIVIDIPRAVVTLRNVSIVGLGGRFGINFQRGSILNVENVNISGFQGSRGAGIKFQPPTMFEGKLNVADSVITNNGDGANGGGIIIEPGGSGSARVVLNRVQVENNTHGILADLSLQTGSSIVQIRDSVFAGSAGNGIAALTAGAGGASSGIVVDRTSSINNAGSGILAQGSGALVHIGNSTVVGNGAGLNPASAGRIFSYQNNQAIGNSIDGAPTGVLALK